MADTFGLAQALCARLCHDLGGPTGALGNALELLDGVADEAAEVARDAARIIDRRIRFWRAAVGGSAGDLDAAAITQLAEGLTLGRRAAVDVAGLAEDAPLPAVLSRAVLLAMLLGIEALPRGGTLRVAGSLSDGVTVWPDGIAAAWPAALPAMLGGTSPDLSPRSIALPLLGTMMSHVRIELLPGRGDAPGPLVLRLS
jgi:histidine phosphotransferase ChpT